MIKLTDNVLDQEILGDIEIPPKSEFDNKTLIRASPTMITSMTVNCPRQADARYGINLPKPPFVPNAATEFGKKAHKAAENYFKFDTPVPKPIQKKLPGFLSRLQAYKAHAQFNPAGVERGLYINADGPCHKWEHAISVDSDLCIDVPTHATMIYCDWKTNSTHTGSGNYKPAKLDEVQAELTACLAFMCDPKLMLFVAQYEFLQHGETVRAVFDRRKSTYTVILPDGTVMENDYSIPGQVAQTWWRQRNNKFEAQPSGLCEKWCQAKCKYAGVPIREHGKLR